MEPCAHQLRSALHSIAFVCLVALSAVACSDNDSPYATSIGLACRGDLDCAPGVSCEHGKQFGDGTCTYPCGDHSECPGGAACVDVNGGHCLVTCADDSWCQPGFHCK